MTQYEIQYLTFEQWWDENEIFCTRGERATAWLGVDAKKWLQTAWALGQISAENTSDGHSGEAAKDVRKAGYEDAADHIENFTIPEGRKIIKSNIHQIAVNAGLIEPHPFHKR